MWAYIIRRIFQTVPTLLISSLLIFSLLYVTPGDPVELILGTEDANVSEEQRKLVEEQGLDKPFLVRYIRFIKGAFVGDLGTSYATGEDVFSSVAKRMPNTLKLAGSAMVIALVVSLPLGILAALKHNGILDSVATALAYRCQDSGSVWF